MKRTVTIFSSLLLLVLLGVFCSGKIFAEEEEREIPRREVKQSHKRHVEEMEIECWKCHRGANKRAHSGMPVMEICGDCHEVETQDKTDEKSGCLKCHTFEKPNPKCTIKSCPKEELPEIIVTQLGPDKPYNLKYSVEGEVGGFSHKIHFDKNVQCSRCHGDLARDEQIPFPSGDYIPKAYRCFNCHAKEFNGFSHKRHIGRGLACLECHGNINRQFPYARDKRSRSPMMGWQLPEKPFPTGKYIPVLEIECRKCHTPRSFKCDTCHIPDSVDENDIPDTHFRDWERDGSFTE